MNDVVKQVLKKFEIDIIKVKGIKTGNFNNSHIVELAKNSGLQSQISHFNHIGRSSLLHMDIWSQNIMVIFDY